MTGQFHSHLMRSPVIGGRAAIDGLTSQPLLQASVRPLVLAGVNVSKTPFFAAVLQRLQKADRQPAVVSDVPSPATCALIEALAAQHRRDPWDAIIAVGGGSTLDSAKALSLIIARGGTVQDHAIARAGDRVTQRAQLAPFLPIVAIPTTLSGSEANMNASIRNRTTGERFSIADPGLLPCLIVLDPAALESHRRELLLGSSFNALAHCIEAIYSTRHHPLADAQAQTAARLLCSVLDNAGSVAQSDSLLRLQMASVIAGGLISEVYVGLHHAMCHAVVSLCGVEHAQANGAILPCIVDFNLRALAADSDERLGIVAEALGISPMGGADQITSAIRARLERLQATAGIPRRLSQLGVQPERARALADYTLRDRALNTNPVSVDRARLVALFEQVM